MTKNILHFFILYLAFNNIMAQEIGTGQWQEHLPYSSAKQLEISNETIYCLTTGGLFTFNTNDNALQKLSKTAGLSEAIPSAILMNKQTQKLIIGYKNGNIDVIEQGVITNIPDVKSKQVSYSKTINSIYCAENLAYLSCDFGVLVLDANSNTILDTYFIGPNGTPTKTFAFTASNNAYYAATELGVFKTEINNPNLSNFDAWELAPELPTGIYNTITFFNNNVYVNHARHLENSSLLNDSIYVYKNNTWSFFGNGNIPVNNINSTTNHLLIAEQNKALIYDNTETLIKSYTSYFGSTATPQQIVKSEQAVWIADENKGLIADNDGLAYHFPNGPKSLNSSEIAIWENQLWVAPGPSNNQNSSKGLYTYQNNDWLTITGTTPNVVNVDTINSINHVLINPYNQSQVYASSSSGIIEFINNIPASTHTTPKNVFTNECDIQGMAFNSKGELWALNSRTSSCLTLKKSDGSWQSLDFSNILGTQPFLTNLLIDNLDQIWMVINNEGILVYNGSGDAPTETNTQRVSTGENQGSLASSTITALEIGINNEIWVATNEGINLFLSASSIFGGGDFDAELMYIMQDNASQVLFNNITITDIAIDGGNRKWISTPSNGVFLMSEAGDEQLIHFDENNSPLLSNNVKTIAINQPTGEVFFGTENGIIAYRGTASQSQQNFSAVKVFPNPVKPEYNGPITISGLQYNSTIKITDISGNIVFETLSEGGTAVWNGNNILGNRVSTGVYMIFCMNEDGSEDLATKVVIIN